MAHNPNAVMYSWDNIESRFGRNLPSKAVEHLQQLTATLSDKFKLAKPSSWLPPGITAEQMGAIEMMLAKIPASQDTPAMAGIRTIFNDKFKGIAGVESEHRTSFNNGGEKLRKVEQSTMASFIPQDAEASPLMQTPSQQQQFQASGSNEQRAQQARWQAEQQLRQASIRPSAEVVPHTPTARLYMRQLLHPNPTSKPHP